jgi:hypothetical protein
MTMHVTRSTTEKKRMEVGFHREKSVSAEMVL